MLIFTGVFGLCLQPTDNHVTSAASARMELILGAPFR